MHYRTNLNEHYDGITGLGNVYADGMVELDDDVGELLNLLDELGGADSTMVMFSTDNGAASNSWPDGGNQPFRGEKGVGGYEGGFKVPMMVKWPGLIPEGTTTGELMTMEDWIPTIMSQLGEPDLKESLLEGAEIGGEGQARRRVTSRQCCRQQAGGGDPRGPCRHASRRFLPDG